VPLNFLDLIKGEGQVIGYIKEAIEAGKKATETLESLRASGLGIRSQTFYQVYNYFTGPVAEAKSYISNVNLNSLPSIARLPLSATKQLRNFSYHAQVEVVDSFTGEKSTKHLTVSTNNLLTKQQAIDEIANRVEGNEGGRYPYDFSGAQITDVFANSAGLV